MTLADKMTEYAHLKATVLPERDRLKAINAELLAALQIMTDHAAETYPHFKSERGQRDIDAARAAIAKARGET